MSHFTTLNKVAIKDTEAFIRAAKELGFTQVERNAKMRGYQGTTQQAEVVVKKPGCQYDIGLVKKNGKLEVVADWWGVRQHVDDPENRITQLTTKHTLMRKYSAMGFAAQTSVDKQGNVNITLSR